MVWALIIQLVTGEAVVTKPAQLFPTRAACYQALEAEFLAGLRQPLADNTGRVLFCRVRP